MQPHAQLPWKPYPQLTDAERVEAARSFYETMKSRRSCRFIGDTPISRDVLDAAIAAAGTAPSGANHQPWHFSIITSAYAKKRLRELAEAEEKEFYSGKAGDDWLNALKEFGTDDYKPYLEDAPAIIVVFGQRRGGAQIGEDNKNYYITESVGIATGFLMASLHLAGLATLIHTPAPMAFLNDICERPAHERPLMLIVVGHPEPEATFPVHATIKKRVDEITNWI